MRAFPLILVVGLTACSYRGGAGGPGYAPGTTQNEVMSGLTSRDRVLFRDDEMMIVEGPSGTRQLRFDKRGRLETDTPSGGGVGGGVR